MLLLNKYIPLLISLSILFNSIVSATITTTMTHFNLTLPHQHPQPESIVQDFQRRVRDSISQRSQCGTGNPIDDCWRCDPNWNSNRQSLANCGIGFGRDALGGRGGEVYLVTDSSDDADPQNPKPGTIRFGAMQAQPLWIVFSTSMVIKLKTVLLISSFKTMDGRGADVHIVGSGCISVHHVTNVIIHNINIHDCVPSHHGSFSSDGDGISVLDSKLIWVDHCTLSRCRDGLIDVTEGSTAVTISNNYMSHHDKVMLLGHSDRNVDDKGMQVTVAFNHFGPQLVERMPRCRWGYFHVANNLYTEWTQYAVGGSANPTINSQGNCYVAPENKDAKQVTARMDADKDEWSKWNWRSQGDVMVNGAFFVTSGDGFSPQYAKASSMEPHVGAAVVQLTLNAGVLGENGDNNVRAPPGCSGIGGGGGGGGGGVPGFGPGGGGIGPGEGEGAGGSYGEPGGMTYMGYNFGSDATRRQAVFSSLFVSMVCVHTLFYHQTISHWVGYVFLL
ncbi:hypothetical protein Scep_015426 [Stephania cephalantha]|uniref:Pectate lyase n=1 Tax=Stephania cephalantha TaxID=152367 RepID=A0AAP0P2T2_9MAGN